MNLNETVWNSVNLSKSLWNCIKLSKSVWDCKNLYESEQIWWRLGGSGWNWVNLDWNEWIWTHLHESEWIWSVLSESLCVRFKTPSKARETPPFPPISYPALAGLIGSDCSLQALCPVLKSSYHSQTLTDASSKFALTHWVSQSLRICCKLAAK